jgi:phosphatidylglycerophosphatase A
MSNFIATFFYIGHLRPAPGTWGSFAALPAAAIVFAFTGTWIFIALTVALYFLGVWATKLETAGKDNHDPSEIVIDEVVGQWIALMPVLIGANYVGVDLLALWPGWIAAFVLFRFFDITKLGPVGWADKRDDAVGVMLDDVIAGVFAAIGVVIFGVLYHVVIL